MHLQNQERSSTFDINRLTGRNLKEIARIPKLQARVKELGEIRKYLDNALLFQMHL